jgi:uncharacterized protein (TIGR03085 family)
MALRERERRELVETLRAADPDAPTLCEGWSVRHLLAHLVQRDHHPAWFAVDQLERRPPGQERYLGRLVAEAATPEGYGRLVDTFAAGPPRWAPLNLGGDAANLSEYVVHHEDIRRGGPHPAEPRRLPLDTEHALWRSLPGAARLGLRAVSGGVRLEAPGRTPLVVRKGATTTVLCGEPVELVLYAVGRRAAARVELRSEPG